MDAEGGCIEASRSEQYIKYINHEIQQEIDFLIHRFRLMKNAHNSWAGKGEPLMRDNFRESVRNFVIREILFYLFDIHGSPVSLVKLHFV